MSEFSRETLLSIIETDHVQCGEASALARMALTAMDSEPVAWIVHARTGDQLTTDGGYVANAEGILGLHSTPLYRHAQPAPARDRVRCEHAEWSHATFGNVGPVGPLKHLSKEALEAAAEPGDLSEWADMQFLMWDAQRRAGITDEQITQAMIEKLAVNKQREWPEPKEGEPRMHIQEQPAPVVDADDNFYSWFGREWHENYQHNQYTTAAKQMLGVMAESAWKAGRCAAMLQELQKSAGAEEICRSSENEQDMQDMQAGNSPVIPGWIPVSERMPEVGVKVLAFPVEDEPIHAIFNGQLWLQDISWSSSDEPIDNVIPRNVTHWMPLPAAPQEVKGD